MISPMPEVTVVPWGRAAAPGEAEVRRRMEHEGLRPYLWSEAAQHVFGRHHHPYAKVLYCVRGSIRFVLSRSGEELPLAPGDRLVLPAGVDHSAIVGPEGAACLEARAD